MKKVIGKAKKINRCGAGAGRSPSETGHFVFKTWYNYIYYKLRLIFMLTPEIIFRVVVAILLGSLLGLERTLAGKTAGMRTYSMVALGAAVFSIISQSVHTPDINFENPLALAPAIISGIGFIGAGLILFQPQEHKLTGLTTAAGLWVSASVGMATGYGLFNIAIVTAVATLVVFTISHGLEKKLGQRFSYKTGKFEGENHNEN